MPVLAKYETRSIIYFMSINPEQFFIRSHIYDALSGEFRPPTDPEKRLHTLGRLAIATVTKGQYTLNHEDESFDPLFTYRPSWAPDVTAQVTGEYLTPHLMAIASLDLNDESGRGLFVSDETDKSGVVLQIDDSEEPGDGIYYDLALGAELQDARAAVTKAAQEFFSAQS
jgi:hypothetical protein